MRPPDFHKIPELLQQNACVACVAAALVAELTSWLQILGFARVPWTMYVKARHSVFCDRGAIQMQNLVDQELEFWRCCSRLLWLHSCASRVADELMGATSGGDTH